MGVGSADQRSAARLAPVAFATHDSRRQERRSQQATHAERPVFGSNTVRLMLERIGAQAVRLSGRGELAREFVIRAAAERGAARRQGAIRAFGQGIPDCLPDRLVVWTRNQDRCRPALFGKGTWVFPHGVDRLWLNREKRSGYQGEGAQGPGFHRSVCVGCRATDCNRTR